MSFKRAPPLYRLLNTGLHTKNKVNLKLFKYNNYLQGKIRSSVMNSDFSMIVLKKNKFIVDKNR